MISSGCLTHSKDTSKSTTPKIENKVDKNKVEKKKDPRSYFKFDKKGKVKTKSGKAERTFNFPDIKVGFIFVAPQLDILPVLAIEMYEFKKIPVYFDFGISPHVAYFSIGYNIIPIYEVGVFGWVGYHFLDRNTEFWGKKFYGITFGIGITVIKF